MAEETEMEIPEAELDEEIAEAELDEENVAQMLEEEADNGETLEESNPENEEEVEVEGEEQLMAESEGAPSSAAGPRLFVGGLHSKTKLQDLRAHFEKYGPLVECSIAQKKPRIGGKSKSRGFGFVAMATQEGTEAVLKDTHVLNDKIVSVMVSKPPDAPERKLRLLVSNLDVEKTTEETLRAHFSQFGTLAECILAKEKSGGKTVSRGLGFVTMSTEEEVKSALDACVNGRQSLDGKDVLVKRVVSTMQYYGKDRKLWFGGLDAEKTTESDIIEHFSTFGTVVDCVIVRDQPETEGGEAKSKGYGYLSMGSVSEAGAILKHNKLHKIHGKVLVFNRSLQRSTDPDYDPYPIKQIYVSGIKDSPVNADALKAYFSTHANVKYVSILRDQGAALVTMDKSEDAEKLAHMRDHMIQKHWVTARKFDCGTSSMKLDKMAKQEKTALKGGKPKGPAFTGDGRGRGMGRGMGRGHAMGMGMGRGMVRGRGMGRGMAGMGRGMGAMGMGRTGPMSRGAGPIQAKNRKQDQRQGKGFGNAGGRGAKSSYSQYYNEPTQDTYGSQMGRFSNYNPPQSDSYYDDDLSGYGPVRGSDISSTLPRAHKGGRGRSGEDEATGGWVYVENLYGHSEDQGELSSPWPKKGYKGKGRGSALSSGYGDLGSTSTSGMGGGYGEDWGDAQSMSRGRSWPY